MKKKTKEKHVVGAMSMVGLNVILSGFSSSYLLLTGSPKEGMLFGLSGIISLLALIDLKKLRKKLSPTKPETQKSSLTDDPYFVDRARIHS